jgi:hypothetical protein
VSIEPNARASGRRNLARVVVAALLLGLAAATISYLASSLQIPGPAQAATTPELRDRGAERYMGFCGNTFEPRFWPECLGGADDWRQRGADQLVAFCIRHEPSRMFTGPDCEGTDRPAAVLTGGPRPMDLAVGALAAVVALTVFGLLAVGRRAPRREPKGYL